MVRISCCRRHCFLRGCRMGVLHFRINSGKDAVYLSMSWVNMLKNPGWDVAKAVLTAPKVRRRYESTGARASRWYPKPRQTKVTLNNGFLRSKRDIVMRAYKLLDTKQHIHVPFLAHRWIGIRCCVVLCTERNNRGVNGVFTNKGGGRMLEP